MTMTDTKITRFDAGDGFYVDIVENATDLEAWISHVDYGVSEMTLACPKVQQSGTDMDFYAFLSIVEYSLWEDEELFSKKYMEDE